MLIYKVFTYPERELEQTREKHWIRKKEVKYKEISTQKKVKRLFSDGIRQTSVSSCTVEP